MCALASGPDKLNFLRNIDPFGFLRACNDVQNAWAKHPDLLAEEIQKLTYNFVALLDEYQNKLLLQCPDNNLKESSAVTTSDSSSLPIVYQENGLMHLIQENYRILANWCESCILNTPTLEDRIKRKANFVIQQWLYMFSPENYFWLNPKALQKCVETGGQSLVKGMELWSEDIRYGNLSMAPRGYFEIGRNLATTPGKVIFRNFLVELIQYLPQTDKVHAIPILIVPPWINKYYILDINHEKSVVNFLLSQGFTVFMISWKNPDAGMRGTTYEDYLFQGILKAVEIVKDICQVPQVHALGYCIGGTALSTLMAWLNNNPNIVTNPIAHWTLLCSLVDFSCPGEIDMFIDEDSIASIEEMMSKTGYLDSKQMEFTFRVLRSQNLIWNYFVEKYLFGKEPTPFDILYWNMDGTRLPEKMHSYYLRQLYLHNQLVKKHALSFQKISIDLGAIVQPLYMVGTEQDHITPWKETFKICSVIQGTVRYVLAASGHIMGVLSPPQDPPKRFYWVSEDNKQHAPDKWLEDQEKIWGSWWIDWAKWLDQRCGHWQKAPAIGNERYLPLEDAPGRYVKEE